MIAYFIWVGGMPVAALVANHLIKPGDPTAVFPTPRWALICAAAFAWPITGPVYLLQKFGVID